MIAAADLAHLTLRDEVVERRKRFLKCPVPIAQMLSKAYARERARLVNADKAGESDRSIAPFTGQNLSARRPTAAYATPAAWNGR